MARAPAGSGLLIVRGSAPEDTQIFVDGMDVPLVYHFGGLRSVLPEGVIDNIEFVPGNFSPEYGRATGGIVDVHLKELKPKRFGGYVDVSVLDTGVYLEGPLGRPGRHRRRRAAQLPGRHPERRRPQRRAGQPG